MVGARRQWWVSPVKEPFRIFGAQIHAAVTHWLAEIAVPVSTVQGITPIKVHSIRYIR